LAGRRSEVVAMLGVLVALCGLAALIASPFAFYQIITKAGYSGWWTFVPYSPWIVAFLGAGIFRTVDTNRSIGTTFDELGLWGVLTFLTGIFVMIMFFIFAFSAWPSLQPSRFRGIPNGYTPGDNRQPSWIPAPPPASGPVDAPAAQEPAPAQPSGWYKTGPVGAGMQGYWDGQAWTAHRQWKNGAWVELPMEAVGPSEANAEL
jgi:hypothetical protein